MRRIRKPGGPDILSGLGSTDCQPPMSMQRYDYSFRLTNYDLSKQSYTFSVTCFHIYPGWYQLIISKIIRTFATGGLMPDFYC